MLYALPCNRLTPENQAMVDHIAAGEEYRHLILNDFPNEVKDRWATVVPMLTVNSISVARGLKSRGIETEGFEGGVDYLLLNFIKQRRMLFCVAFHHEGDAILWKMRQPSEFNLREAMQAG